MSDFDDTYSSSAMPDVAASGAVFVTEAPAPAPRRRTPAADRQSHRPQQPRHRGVHDSTAAEIDDDTAPPPRRRTAATVRAGEWVGDEGSGLTPQPKRVYRGPAERSLPIASSIVAATPSAPTITSGRSWDRYLERPAEPIAPNHIADSAFCGDDDALLEGLLAGLDGDAPTASLPQLPCPLPQQPQQRQQRTQEQQQTHITHQSHIFAVPPPRAPALGSRQHTAAAIETRGRSSAAPRAQASTPAPNFTSTVRSVASGSSGGGGGGGGGGGRWSRFVPSSACAVQADGAAEDDEACFVTTLADERLEVVD